MFFLKKTKPTPYNNAKIVIVAQCDKNYAILMCACPVAAAVSLLALTIVHCQYCRCMTHSSHTSHFQSKINAARLSDRIECIVKSVWDIFCPHKIPDGWIPAAKAGLRLWKRAMGNVAWFWKLVFIFALISKVLYVFFFFNWTKA